MLRIGCCFVLCFEEIIMMVSDMEILEDRFILMIYFYINNNLKDGFVI